MAGWRGDGARSHRPPALGPPLGPFGKWKASRERWFKVRPASTERVVLAQRCSTQAPGGFKVDPPGGWGVQRRSDVYRVRAKAGASGRARVRARGGVIGLDLKLGLEVRAIGLGLELGLEVRL